MSGDHLSLWLRNNELIHKNLNNETLISNQNEIIDGIGGIEKVLSICLKHKYNLNLIQHQNLLSILSELANDKSYNDKMTSTITTKLHDICISHIFGYLDKISHISLQTTCRNMIIIGRKKESFNQKYYSSFGIHLNIQHKLIDIISNIKSKHIIHQKYGIKCLKQLVRNANTEQIYILSHSGLEYYLLKILKNCINKLHHRYDIICNICYIIARNENVTAMDLIDSGLVKLIIKYVFKSDNIGLITVSMSILYEYGLYDKFESLWNKNNLFHEIIKAAKCYNSISIDYILPLIDRILKSPSFEWSNDLNQRLIGNEVTRFISVNYYLRPIHNMYRCKVLPTFTRILSFTSPYGADFEGPEMNIHIPSKASLCNNMAISNLKSVTMSNDQRNQTIVPRLESLSMISNQLVVSKERNIPQMKRILFLDEIGLAEQSTYKTLKLSMENSDLSIIGPSRWKSDSDTVKKRMYILSPNRKDLIERMRKCVGSQLNEFIQHALVSNIPQIVEIHNDIENKVGNPCNLNFYSLISYLKLALRRQNQLLVDYNDNIKSMDVDSNCGNSLILYTKNKSQFKINFEKKFCINTTKYIANILNYGCNESEGKCVETSSNVLMASGYNDNCMHTVFSMGLFELTNRMLDKSTSIVLIQNLFHRLLLLRTVLFYPNI